MLPCIPQLLAVQVNTAQEIVQLMQPEFICALGTAIWVKLWSCSLERSLNKPALILYIWFFRDETSQESLLWWILVSPNCYRDRDREMSNSLQVKKNRANNLKIMMLCSKRKVVVLCSPLLKIQGTKPSPPSAQEGQFAEELKYYIGMGITSGWSTLHLLPSKMFTSVKQISHWELTAGFGEARLMESGSTFCSTSIYWVVGRKGQTLVHEVTWATLMKK